MKSFTRTSLAIIFATACFLPFMQPEETPIEQRPIPKEEIANIPFEDMDLAERCKEVNGFKVVLPFDRIGIPFTNIRAPFKEVSFGSNDISVNQDCLTHQRIMRDAENCGNNQDCLNDVAEKAMTFQKGKFARINNAFE